MHSQYPEDENFVAKLMLVISKICRAEAYKYKSPSPHKAQIAPNQDI
jgi:hypothetical protein